jgi:hypothetical protein
MGVLHTQHAFVHAERKKGLFCGSGAARSPARERVVVIAALRVLRPCDNHDLPHCPFFSFRNPGPAAEKMVILKRGKIGESLAACRASIDLLPGEPGRRNGAGLFSRERFAALMATGPSPFPHLPVRGATRGARGTRALIAQMVPQLGRRTENPGAPPGRFSSWIRRSRPNFLFRL